MRDSCGAIFRLYVSLGNFASAKSGSSLPAGYVDWSQRLGRGWHQNSVPKRRTNETAAKIPKRASGAGNYRLLE